MYAQHAELCTVFRFLDTDGNGTVSLPEFLSGVALLNARLPPNRCHAGRAAPRRRAHPACSPRKGFHRPRSYTTVAPVTIATTASYRRLLHHFVVAGSCATRSSSSSSSTWTARESSNLTNSPKPSAFSPRSQPNDPATQPPRLPTSSLRSRPNEAHAMCALVTQFATWLRRRDSGAKAGRFRDAHGAHLHAPLPVR